LKVLILGGYGVFGGRLAKLLSDIPDIALVICGRDLSRAEAFCAAYSGRALAFPLRLDRRDIAEGLRAQSPDLVVDASGPFQDYGDQRYDVIEACIASGVDYVDFADAADFVFGVSRFDAQAKAAGVFVCPGSAAFLSSPLLSCATWPKRCASLPSKGVLRRLPMPGSALTSCVR